MVPPGGIRGGRPPMRGSSRLRPRNWTAAGPALAAAQQKAAQAAPRTPEPARRKRILFVCLGNSCRSQMAEAFARAYGADVIEAHSAGLSPASIIQPWTLQVMLERNISMDGQHPKGLELMTKTVFDLVVNMSGQRLSFPGAPVVDWPVPDPIGRNQAVYRQVAAQIEDLVMRLVLDLRGK
jgi:arsenate reductase